MDAYLKAFWLPKEGSTKSEYEDAFFPRSSRSYPLAKRPRFAIADGATEASYSRLWARLLVSGFVRRRLGLPPAVGELEPIQRRWRSKVGGRPLPWFAEEALANGAFAALLGLEFSEERGATSTVKTWRATAAGDCCLIQVRSNDIINTFPFDDSTAFGSRPDLLGSLPAPNGHDNDMVKTFQGTCGFEDTFFLMSDALACWFFKEREAGNQPWNTLRDLDTQGEVSFHEFVTGLRNSKAMKNDDVTLLRIDIA